MNSLSLSCFVHTNVQWQICVKRGPLGACLQTEMRTDQNDNDKAKKYFRDPAEILREKNAVLRGSDEEGGNALVEKLKAQSEENKEKNRLAVELRTFENDQVRPLQWIKCIASFVFPQLCMSTSHLVNGSTFTVGDFRAFR